MADEAKWWDAWRAADYSWEGLAKKPWAGFSVFRVGEQEIAAETESREIYRVESPSARRMAAMQLDVAGKLVDRLEVETRPEEFVPAGAEALREATLQGYWRADPQTGRLRSDTELIDAGELIVAEGRPAYHIAHLPLTHADGAATGKAACAKDALDPLLAARLAAAGATTWEGAHYDRTLTSPDRRAQLNGCVLLTFDRQALSPRNSKRLSLTCKNAFFLWGCSCSGTAFWGDTTFGRATF
jgi:hypothetical protein